jgi:hypothetical protein
MSAADRAAASQSYQKWAAENYDGNPPVGEADYVGYVREKAAVAERGAIGGQRALNKIEANRANEALAGRKNSKGGEQ